MSKWLHTILLILSWILVNSLLAQGVPKYVVYYDKDYPSWWIKKEAAKELNEYLYELGFATLNAKELAIWIEKVIKENIKDTVIVFSQDVMPDTIVKPPTNKALIRKYLNAGGKVIWLGEVPFYYLGKKNGEVITLGSYAGYSVLGFYPSYKSIEGEEVILTEEAKKRFNLTHQWVGTRPVRIADITYPLAINKANEVHAWIKNYNKKIPLSGFYRIYDCKIEYITSEILADIYYLATSSSNTDVVAGVSPQKSEIKGRIKIFNESDYWSVYHFEKDRLMREIEVIAYNPKMINVEYYLLIDNERINLDKNNKFNYRENVKIPLLSNTQIIKFCYEYENKDHLIATAELKEKELFYKVNVDTKPSQAPILFNTFLLPKEKIIITKDYTLIINWQLVSLVREKEIEIEIERVCVCECVCVKEAHPRKRTSIKKQKIVLPQGVIKNITWQIKGKEFDYGEQELVLKITGEKINIEKNYQLKVLKKEIRLPHFGAYYTNIKYDGPVHIYEKEDKFIKKQWEEVWENRVGPFPDIIVNLQNDDKFLFWRGMNYVPTWVINNTGFIYQWVEAEGGWRGERAKYVVDCVEPLQDKECRYSNVRILTSNPARVIIHWRYALCDLKYNIVDDEWVDEYYYFYPDSFGTRKAVAYLKPATWHEVNEFIVILPAGVNPYEVIEKEAITIIDMTNGNVTKISYPEPKLEWNYGNPALFRINLKNTTKTPILATAAFQGYEAIYRGWKEDKRYISPSYWGHHYPIMRNHPTCKEAPSMWRVSPTHASLLAPKHKEKSKKIMGDKEIKEWVWLIGLTDEKDKELLELARSWLTPSAIEVIKGGKSLGFDFAQRGYIINVEDKAKEITLTLNCSKTNPCINPIFILNNFVADDIKVLINKKEIKNYKFATEKVFIKPNGVIFIEQKLTDKATISISLKKN